MSLCGKHSNHDSIQHAAVSMRYETYSQCNHKRTHHSFALNLGRLMRIIRSNFETEDESATSVKSLECNTLFSEKQQILTKMELLV